MSGKGPSSEACGAGQALTNEAKQYLETAPDSR